MKQFVFTIDIEDHTKGYSMNGRYVGNINKWIDFLEKMDIKGTLFVVGRIAKKHPDIIKKIYSNGHEIGSHSFDHCELTKQNKKKFAETERVSKEIIEEIIGEKINGYRAPVYSLTKKTRWAVEVLKNIGYTYSSSTMPCRNPLNGYPELCNTPFRWKNGIVEFPCPVIEIGTMSIPYLGGIYFRYMPSKVITNILKRRKDEVLWTYAHPYDIDFMEKYAKFPDANTFLSVLLWMNRKRCLKKMKNIFGPYKFKRFADLMRDEIFISNLPNEI